MPSEEAGAEPLMMKNLQPLQLSGRIHCVVHNGATMRGRWWREGVQDFSRLGIEDYHMAVLESKQQFGRECQKGLTRMLQEQIIMPQGPQGSSWPKDSWQFIESC